MLPSTHKNTVNKNSKESSILTVLPFTDIPFASAHNYTNKDGIIPLSGELIHVDDIVFSKEELADNKWLITSMPNNEQFKTEVGKIFSAWRKNCTWIVIQSEEYLKEHKVRLEIENKRQDELHQYNIDHAEFNCQDPSKINSVFIKEKYHSTEDFQRFHSEYHGELTSKFQDGDEIWLYDETLSELTFGSFDVFFLLIRNNKIVYSPWIDGVMRDD